MTNVEGRVITRRGALIGLGTAVGGGLLMHGTMRLAEKHTDRVRIDEEERQRVLQETRKPVPSEDDLSAAHEVYTPIVGKDAQTVIQYTKDHEAQINDAAGAYDRMDRYQKAYNSRKVLSLDGINGNFNEAVVGAVILGGTVYKAFKEQQRRRSTDAIKPSLIVTSIANRIEGLLGAAQDIKAARRTRKQMNRVRQLGYYLPGDPTQKPNEPR